MKYNLTERHARALLRLAAPEERLAVLEKVVRNNLNVEKTEHAVEELLGQRRKRESYRKRSKVFQNVRIFVNTITRAVETMQAAGIAADSQKIQREDYIEYRVRIPSGRRNNVQSGSVSRETLPPFLRGVHGFRRDTACRVRRFYATKIREN